MKRIELKSLHLKNFQGMRNFSITFNSGITNISGENATGKTTVNNAFRWLLFDKDSTDRKQFEIKTLDRNNKPIHGLEHTVTGELYVNDQLKTFEKTYKEKWTKKKGDPKDTMTGHETLYSINGVPVKKSEYESAIAEIVDEVTFKIITDPLYFSSTMPWQKRRDILLGIAGEPSNTDVLACDDALSPLFKLFEEENNIDILRKSLAAKRKKLNDELKSIPVRIDECNNSIVTVNAAEIEKELNAKKAELKQIDDQLLNLTQEDPAIAEKKKQHSNIRSQITTIENNVTDERIQHARELRSTLSKLESEKSEKVSLLTEEKSKLTRLNERAIEADKEITLCRKYWDAEKETKFEFTEDSACPTCKRKLPEETIEKKKAELEENFNQKKAQNLEQYTKDGQAARTRLSSIKDQIAETEERIESINQSVSEYEKLIQQAEKNLRDYEESEPVYPDEYEQLKSQAAQLAEELKTPEDASASIEVLRNNQSALIDQIDDLKTLLQKEESNKQLRTRIKELSDREREVSQLIADIEKNEFLSEQFIRTKVELLDAKINSLFSHVRFKLFDEQINGGLTETCEALIDGVPFSDANNAAKINAGIDIINTLSNHYQVTAPIVIDNRESINEIIPTEAQVINLIVSKDPQLKIEHVHTQKKAASPVQEKVAEEV